ncbi:MAG: hypothetical protein QM741_13665 [Rudaea sp.]|uniref:hypothetical protein n=1 Tax=Rudaea sp. TaxID=2136325 RepID=UPI0039E33E48
MSGYVSGTMAGMTQPDRKPKAATTRARLTNGRALLPGIDGRSLWARLYRDTASALTDHVGGEDRASEPQRLLIRRCTAFEVELLAIEGRLTQTRERGGEPDPADLDLFARLANAQRRFLETLGVDRVPRDVTPSLHEYLNGEA